MTPLKKEQKESVASRVAFIETELLDLEKLAGTTWEIYQTEREVRRNIERMAENIANACIDIGKILLAGEYTEIPGTYKEVILKLGLLKIIDQKLAETLSELTHIRNILAHQYLDIKWQSIKAFLEKAPPAVREFIEAAQRFLVQPSP